MVERGWIALVAPQGRDGERWQRTQPCLHSRWDLQFLSGAVSQKRIAAGFLEKGRDCVHSGYLAATPWQQGTGWGGLLGWARWADLDWIQLSTTLISICTRMSCQQLYLHHPDDLMIICYHDSRDEEVTSQRFLEQTETQRTTMTMTPSTIGFWFTS